MHPYYYTGSRHKNNGGQYQVCPLRESIKICFSNEIVHLFSYVCFVFIIRQNIEVEFYKRTAKN